MVWSYVTVTIKKETFNNKNGGNMLKKVVIPFLILISISGPYSFLFGMEKSFKTISSRFRNTVKNNRKKIALATAAGITGAWLNTRKDDARVALLLQDPKWLRNYPNLRQKAIIHPLLKKVHYDSVDDFINESDKDTLQRQEIARVLLEKGYDLNLSQTEADLLTAPVPQYKKDFIRQSNDLRKKQSIGNFIDYFNKIFTKENQLDTILSAEKIANQQGYDVLYHGMPGNAYALNYIGTRLDECLNDKKLNPKYLELRQSIASQEEDFSLHNKKSWYSNILSYFTNNKDLREQFLNQPSYDWVEEGTIIKEVKFLQGGTDVSPWVRKLLLCATPSLFNGSQHNYEAPLYYWLWQQGGYVAQKIDNDNAFHTLFESRQVPHDLNEKYISQLKNAAKKFTSTNGNGNVMLQMIMPHELLNETTYIAHPYGFKRNVYRGGLGKAKIESPSQLIDQLKRNPFEIAIVPSSKEGNALDSLQVRVIVDQARLLDHKSDDITNNFSVNAYGIDQKRLKDFQCEVDVIMASLRKDLAELENNKK